jgi:hypothetical protein
VAQGPIVKTVPTQFVAAGPHEPLPFPEEDETLTDQSAQMIADRDAIISDLENFIDGIIADLENIVAKIPACSNGEMFVEHHDGDGNYLGSESVDPLGVIGSIDGRIRALIAKLKGSQ